MPHPSLDTIARLLTPKAVDFTVRSYGDSALFARIYYRSTDELDAATVLLFGHGIDYHFGKESTARFLSIPLSPLGQTVDEG